MYTPKILEWDDSLSTGDNTTDEQHKYLIETLNSLGTAILEGNGPEITTRIIGRLRFYAGWHFEREEECFEKYKCPAASMNKNAHAVFIEKFDRYNDKFRETGRSMELALSLHKEISDWVVNHIMRVDGELYSCIHHIPKPGTKRT